MAVITPGFLDGSYASLIHSVLIVTVEMLNDEMEEPPLCKTWSAPIFVRFSFYTSSSTMIRLDSYSHLLSLFFSFSVLLLTSLAIQVHAQNEQVWSVTPFTPPSIPLAVKSPCNNVWAPQGDLSPRINNRYPKLWDAKHDVRTVVPSLFFSLFTDEIFVPRRIRDGMFKS